MLENWHLDFGGPNGDFTYFQHQASKPALVGPFPSKQGNQAVLAFRRYEDASLRFAGIGATKLHGYPHGPIRETAR